MILFHSHQMHNKIVRTVSPDLAPVWAALQQFWPWLFPHNVVVGNPIIISSHHAKPIPFNLAVWPCRLESNPLCFFYLLIGVAPKYRACFWIQFCANSFKLFYGWSLLPEQWYNCLHGGQLQLLLWSYRYFRRQFQNTWTESAKHVTKL